MREAVVRGNGPILLLAWTAGYLNALSFLGLRVFTANMTGNTVLLGLAVAQLDKGALLRTLTSMVGFCVGAFGGTFIVARNGARSGRSWTPQITLALFIESCLLFLFAVIWFQTRESIPHDTLIVEELIALDALAMGQQSATMLSFGIPAVSTTYITGTITNLMVGLSKEILLKTPSDTAATAQTNRRLTAYLAAVWGTYLVAAILGGLGDIFFSSIAVFLPLVAILVVTLCALRNQMAYEEEG